MSINNLLNEIEEDIKDMKSTEIQYLTTKGVPSRSNSTMSFEIGNNKRGKILTSCILYADIRNSITLTKKHHTDTMAKVYSIFSKSILKIARHHSGYVRNIIGDRVMVVFPQENCFTNAVDCAISINSMSKIINSRLNVDFKCGIGIDYGKLKVIKVGVRRQGEENNENKSLVWVSYPANFASRLTDVANKKIDDTKMKVTYLPYIDFLETHFNKITEFYSLEDFAKNITYYNTGISYKGGRLIGFEKINRNIDYPPILMTNRVYNGYKKENTNCQTIEKKYWKEYSNKGIKDVDLKIYGGNVVWKR